MIRNLLLAAATSANLLQRRQSEEILKNQFTLKPQEVTNELFNLLCSGDKNDHILGYSYLKKMILQSQNQRLVDFNQQFEKAFLFWYTQDMNRNTVNEQFILQKQNIITLNALFLSLHTSSKYRQQFIDVIPFKICELFSKNDTYQLYFYLAFYAQVLKQLEKYRIGMINSKRSAMGSVMLLKITTKIHPQNGVAASLWVDFSIYFSRFNRWVPDHNFLLKCLSQFQLTKQTLIALWEYLNVNIRTTWSLKDFGKLMSCLNWQMLSMSQSTKLYECKQVQSLLKCLKSLLYNFFTSQQHAQTQHQKQIISGFYSYKSFQSVLSFVLSVIEYFSKNNQNQACGNLSQMIIQYSTQVLRLYVTYLQQQIVQSYAKQFISRENERKNYENILILLSSMPRFILTLFDYDEVTKLLLQGKMILQESYEPVYVGYLIHVIEVNQYMEVEVIEKIGEFLYNLIKGRQYVLGQVERGEELTQGGCKAVEKISLALYGLSKLAKYKQFSFTNPQYFQTIQHHTFTLLTTPTNDFSLIIDCLNQLTRQQNPQWNQFICHRCMLMLQNIYSNSLKQVKMQYYQLEIELYRMINRTFSLVMMVDSIQQLITKTNLIEMGNITHSGNSLNQFTELNLLIQICNLQKKSAPVKEQIIILIENIFITINQLRAQGKFMLVHQLLEQLLNTITTKTLFEQIFKTLYETEQCFGNQNQYIKNNKNNLFSKVSLSSQQYAIVDYGPSKQLHLSCIKILLQLLLYEQYLENIYNIISRLHSQYLLCVWEAVEILYPGKILSSLVPQIVQVRLQKIRTGHILQLLESMGLEQETKHTKLKPNTTPSWYQLYRNILREDSVVIDIIHQKVIEQQ